MMTETNAIANHETSSRPLVLLHGWGLNHAIWQPVVSALQSEHEIYCLDLPGFGNKSADVESDYSLDTIARKLLNEIPERSHLLGWSLGGLIASHIAIHFPNKVQSLITVASSPFFVAEEHWPGIKPLVLKSFHQQLKADSHKTIDGFLKIQAMGSPHLKQDIKTIRDLVMTLPQPQSVTLDSSLSLLETADLRLQLEQIKQPFLRLYGEMDSLVPKAAIAQISALNSHSQSLVFAKASHAPFISHNLEFIAVLQHWLETGQTLHLAANGQ